MIQARLIDRPANQEENDLGDYPFAALPRAGETIKLFLEDGLDEYDVQRVEHHFIDHSEPARVALVLRKR